MSPTLLVLIVLFVLFAGGGYWGRDRFGAAGWSPVGIVLLVLVFLWFTGRL